MPQKLQYESGSDWGQEVRARRAVLRRRLGFALCVLIAGGVFGLVVSVVMPSLRSAPPALQKVSIELTNRTSEDLAVSVDPDGGTRILLAPMRAGESDHLRLATGGVFYFDQPGMKGRITIVQLGGTASITVTPDKITAACSDEFGKTRTMIQPTVPKH